MRRSTGAGDGLTACAFRGRRQRTAPIGIGQWAGALACALSAGRPASKRDCILEFSRGVAPPPAESSGLVSFVHDRFYSVHASSYPASQPEEAPSRLRLPHPAFPSSPRVPVAGPYAAGCHEARGKKVSARDRCQRAAFRRGWCRPRSWRTTPSIPTSCGLSSSGALSLSISQSLFRPLGRGPV